MADSGTGWHVDAEIRADPRSPLRRFWDQEIVGRYEDFIHNDALNLPVQLFTGGRMDEPFTVKRAIITALTAIPISKAYSMYRAGAQARNAAALERTFNNAYRLSGKTSKGAKLFVPKVKKLARPTKKGLGLAEKAEAELASNWFGKGYYRTTEAVGYPYRALRNMVFGNGSVSYAADAAENTAYALAAVPTVWEPVYDYVAERLGFRTREEAVVSANGASDGAGDKFVDQQTNRVATVSTPVQDLRMARHVMDEAYGAYKADGDASAFSNRVSQVMAFPEMWQTIAREELLDRFSRQYGGDMQKVFDLAREEKTSGNSRRMDELTRFVNRFKATPPQEWRSDLMGGERWL